MNTYHFWTTFQWLLVQGLEVVTIPIVGFVCLLLTSGMIASLAWQRPISNRRLKPHYWLVLIQFLFVPAVAAIGTLYQAGVLAPSQPLPQVNPAGERLIDVLFFLSSGYRAPSY